jgi:hypothetical protein
MTNKPARHRAKNQDEEDVATQKKARAILDQRRLLAKKDGFH